MSSVQEQYQFLWRKLPVFGWFLGFFALVFVSCTFISTADLPLSPPVNIWHNILWLILGLLYQAFHIDLQPSAALNVFHIQILPSLPLGQLMLFSVLNAGFLVVCTLGFVRLFRRSIVPKNMEEYLPSVLMSAILADLLGHLLTYFSLNVTELRYLIPGGIFAGILRYPAIARAIPECHQAKIILAFLSVRVLTYGVVLVQAPHTEAPKSHLITFLEGHHLTYGFGTFWVANVTTLRSDARIHMVPVTEQYGCIYPFNWHSNTAWFHDSQLGGARFVVIDESVSATCFHRAIVKSFGEPDHIDYLDSDTRYMIFPWNHPIVGSSLASTSSAYAVSYCHSQ